MTRIKLIAFLFLSPIIGFSILALLTYLQVSYAEKSVPEDSLDDSAVHAGVSYIMFVVIPLFLYVVVSNFIIWFQLVSKKMESLVRLLFVSYISLFLLLCFARLVFAIFVKSSGFLLLNELSFVLVFFVTLSVIHFPTCCFYWLLENKKQF